MDIRQHLGLKKLRRRGLKGRRNEELFEPEHDESSVNIVRLLKACTAKKDLHKGSELHAYIQKHNYLGENAYVGSTLVSMYAKCGALAKAQQVLTGLSFRDVASWNALIAGYAQQGQGKQALKCVDDMLCEGHFPTVVTFICALKACGSSGAAAKGKEIHEKIVSFGMLEKDIVLGTALIDMYVKCGALDKAQQTLEELPIRDVVSWNALIAGYAQKGEGEEALKCFNDMVYEGHSPTSVTFACVLRGCGNIGAVTQGEEIHKKIVAMGMLEKSIVLGNTLVDMYVKCGALAKARQVLKDLPISDEVSWNVLIAGYAQQGRGEEALKCFDDMLHEGHLPSAVTFACVLKACGSLGVAAKGQEFHERIVSTGMLKRDAVLGNALVNMYVKCGELGKAQQVLEELCIRDTVSWTALITGYVQKGQGEEALKCFDDMVREGHSPTAITFISALKACASIQAVAKGEEILEKIVNMGMLEKDIVLGTALVDMYVKCSALAKAQQVLKQFAIRDVVSWDLLIAGHVERGEGEEALKYFDDMLLEGHSPAVVTFVCVLKACGSIGAAARAKEIHDKIVSLVLLEKDVVIGNSLIDMYVKFGALAKARQVLEELPIRDVVSYSTLISGHAQQGKGEEALMLFDYMLCEGHSPTKVTFVCVLKACGSIRAAVKGEEIHEKIFHAGMLEKDSVLGTTLVDMYVKCGALLKAQKVLEELCIRDMVSWSAVIAGYTQIGKGEDALKCFNDMLHEGLSPTAATFTCVLKACGIVGATAKGEEIHEMIINMGMLEKDIVLGNALLDMYMKCGAFTKAQQVLKELPILDAVSLNTLIAGYAQQGQGEEALKCFDDMLCEGLSPTVFTFDCVLKACGSIGATAKGAEIHEMMVNMGMLEKDVVLWTTLLDMYVKCGVLVKAQQVLEELHTRNVVSWSALIAGYAQNGQGEEALKCFDNMLCEGHSPTPITFACALRACGSIGAVARGEEILEKIVNMGLLKKDIVLGNAVVDMYVKCGTFPKARQVIKELPVCDVVSWNALISGYAQQGQGVEAINWFERMQSNGLTPNLFSLTAVLNACSHSGLIDQAETYFLGMITRFSIVPSLEHYCCMIDSFARAGKFNKALSVIAEMPYDRCLPSWLALLGACRKWAEVKLGLLAFECAVNLNMSSPAYVLVADIYTAAGMQEEARDIETMRMANKASESDK